LTPSLLPAFVFQPAQPKDRKNSDKSSYQGTGHEIKGRSRRDRLAAGWCQEILASGKATSRRRARQRNSSPGQPNVPPRVPLSIDYNLAFGAEAPIDFMGMMKSLELMPFDLQPTLKGALVELRPLRPNDADALYAVASDPLIWDQHPAPRYQPEVFSTFFRESLASRGALTVLDGQDGRIIGSSRFHGYNEPASEVEIGWTFLARSHWGGKYNREMKQLMLRHAFQFVRRVVFLIAPANLRSQKAIEKLGGVRVGRRPDASGRDSYLYEIASLPA